MLRCADDTKATQRNILVGDTLGDPFMITGRPGGKCEIYGRLTGFSGTKFEGSFPILEITTPGGSLVTTGRVWCHVIDDPNEMIKLLHFEELHRQDRSDRPIYDGRLDWLDSVISSAEQGPQD